VSDNLLSQVAEIRRITERNATGVHEARGSARDLVAQAAALRGAVGGSARTRARANGR
jgi:hypothetical protein